MLIRIVKLHIQPEKSEDFIALFYAAQPTILGMNGCISVILTVDAEVPNIFYTHSTWSNETALNAYRDTTFFKTTWAATKALFEHKAEAFSLIPHKA